MIEVLFKPAFIRQMQKLESALRMETIEKIELFKNPDNHILLKVHKLHGKLSGCSSFSINYRFRIVFEHISKRQAVLLVIDDHDFYK